METHLKVTDDYSLIPVDDDGIDYLYKRNPGEILKCKVTVERNYKLLQKAFCLVRVVHDALPPPEPLMFQGRLVQPERTLDNTRDYLTILSGEYIVIGLPDGSVRVEPKSWSFGKMDEEKFEKFYSRLIDSCLKALPAEWSEEELERVATEVMGFV